MNIKCSSKINVSRSVRVVYPLRRLSKTVCYWIGFIMISSWLIWYKLVKLVLHYVALFFLFKYYEISGPLDHTINDFWRMVWQENVPVIVMVTELVENGKVNTRFFFFTFFNIIFCNKLILAKFFSVICN